MDRAGQETLIMNLYRNVDREEIQFDFLCYSNKKGDFDDEIRELGGHIHYLPAPKIKIPHLHNLGTIINLREFFKTHKEYQIVHFHNYHAFSVLIQLIGAKWGDVKNIIVHSHNTNAPNPLIHKLSRPILNLFKFHKFACSNDAGLWMFGHGSKYTVIKNGIDVNAFIFNKDDRVRIREELGLLEKNIILHIGRFNYQKNHKFIIEVFEKILTEQPNTHLLLVGQGELRREIETLVESKRLNHNVTFLGMRSDVPALLSASDLFLFPSLFEGLGIALIEAQASGIRILTTSNLPQETVYCNNAIQLPTNNNTEIWANKALELLQKYERKNMLEKVVAAGYDIKEVSNNLSEFYTSLDNV